MNNIGTHRSPWLHSICRECFHNKINEQYRGTIQISHNLDSLQIELCCFCKVLHNSGIYIRHDPRQLSCLGLHDSSITTAVSSATEREAYSVLRLMLENPEKCACLSEAEVDAIHYLLTIGEFHQKGKK